MSGFFALPRHVIKNIHFNTRGYKLLLELLVKVNESIRVKEIPYTFTDRKSGESKLDFNVVFDYVKSVWYLYRYGRKSNKGIIQNKEAKRNSVLFLSKAGRFFTVRGKLAAIKLFSIIPAIKWDISKPLVSGSYYDWNTLFHNFKLFPK